MDNQGFTSSKTSPFGMNPQISTNKNKQSFRPEEFGYKWSQKPSNLADDSHAVISYFAVNHSIEFFYINLKIVPGLEKRSFTCFRGEQSYRSLEGW